MNLVDWAVVGVYLLTLCGVGLLQRRRAQASVDDYFASGRRLPWWIAGTSMIAAWFASDTPLLVSGLVREFGVWRNWLWWGSAIAIMLTVFFFSRLWRRSLVLTEVELTELRYSGRNAAVLRGFKAIYWGLLINCFIAGAWSVTGLAKVTRATTGLPPETAIIICAIVAGGYSVLSGFWGVVATDVLQFMVAIFGAVALAWFSVSAAGGWDAVLLTVTPDKLAFIPPRDSSMFPWFLSFIAVNWWAWRNVDGGGLLVQRMAACRSERHAVYATLWFSLFHYSIRCWPWVIAALASLVVIPDAMLPFKAGSLVARDHEMAYPLLITTVLPAGLRGLLVGWFFAEFMSSINTHTNLGSSMLVNDLYRRFWNREGSQADYVRAGRVGTGLVLAGAVATAFVTGDIARSVEQLLQGTAAIGPVLVLRWLWWRVNAWTEVVVMVLSPLATFIHPLLVQPVLRAVGMPEDRMVSLLSVVLLALVPALVVTFMTAPESDATLREFYRRVRPPGPGWRRIAASCPDAAPAEPIGRLLGLWLLGVATVFGVLYAGHALLFRLPHAVPTAAAALTALALLLWLVQEVDEVLPGSPSPASVEQGR